MAEDDRLTVTATAEKSKRSRSEMCIRDRVRRGETTLKWIDELQKLRVIPVVRLKDADTAVPMAAALRRGGLPCACLLYTSS